MAREGALAGRPLGGCRSVAAPLPDHVHPHLAPVLGADVDERRVAPGPDLPWERRVSVGAAPVGPPRVKRDELDGAVAVQIAEPPDRVAPVMCDE